MLTWIWGNCIFSLNFLPPFQVGGVHVIPAAWPPLTNCCWSLCDILLICDLFGFIFTGESCCCTTNNHGRLVSAPDSFVSAQKWLSWVRERSTAVQVTVCAWTVWNERVGDVHEALNIKTCRKRVLFRFVVRAWFLFCFSFWTTRWRQITFFCCKMWDL